MKNQLNVGMHRSNLTSKFRTTYDWLYELRLKSPNSSRHHHFGTRYYLHPPEKLILATSSPPPQYFSICTSAGTVERKDYIKIL